MTVRLFSSLGTTEPLDAVFDDAALLQAMVRFETALARAEEVAGVIPGNAAEVIARSATGVAFDAAAIARASRGSGTIAIPFVDKLRSSVAAEDAAAATFVH